MLSPALGRRAAFDERSRSYGLSKAVQKRQPRSYTWRCEAALDQGAEPECVGFAWAHDLIARPVVVPLANGSMDARGLYRHAQRIDRLEGRHWPEGASVLAGAKALKELGLLHSYRWAFGVEELASAVSWQGPAVVGIDWSESMSAPGPDGYARPGGAELGGHALIVRAYSAPHRRFLIHNSWGSAWGGIGGAPPGCAWVAAEDMARLLADNGEACVPVLRRFPRRSTPREPFHVEP